MSSPVSGTISGGASIGRTPGIPRPPPMKFAAPTIYMVTRPWWPVPVCLTSAGTAKTSPFRTSNLLDSLVGMPPCLTLGSPRSRPGILCTSDTPPGSPIGLGSPLARLLVPPPTLHQRHQPPHLQPRQLQHLNRFRPYPMTNDSTSVGSDNLPKGG